MLQIFVALLAAIAATAVTAGEPVAPIPFDQLGAHAQKQYSGEGLALTPTPDGARLRCDFQRLEGELNGSGLWLRSTAANASGTPFRVLATAFGRTGVADTPLPATGTVQATEKLARLLRPGLTEEYSVSVDGVRQDFVVLARPAGEGELRVDLAVDGARTESAKAGAQLVLADGGRKLAYSRLRVTDANGRELPARLTVTAPDRLAVAVADADAVYPVRIDPTFSDANWVALNPGIPGANAAVNDVAMDGNGNIYIAGAFTFVGTVPANRVAKWDGTSWSALGLAMNEDTALVSALAISGTNLYAGGRFDRAGGVTAYNIAKWDGNAWSALGPGVSANVYVLKASGSDLYVGGLFASAGGITVNHVAKWNGSNWSALGSGVDDNVYALEVNGSDVYAGGTFEFAGGTRANYIAKWDGSAWSPLGKGMNSSVFALKMHGTNLYAGGTFWNATNNGPSTVAANHIAKWDGSAWSAIGSGMSSSVYSFTVNGPDLYVTGTFTNAGGVVANRVARWNGSTWSAVGSGMNGVVNSLVISGTNFFAGGVFTNAGGTLAMCVAKWDGSAWSALGPGMENEVNALAVSGSDLYVGGRFSMISGLLVNRIAKWNGTAWSALGTGVDHEVLTLMVSGTNLYAGGWFTNAGGVTVNGIAKWNGSTWSAFGAGMANTPSPSAVTALAMVGGDLYAGGSFHTAGGGAALRIAKWNGNTWSPVGGGFNGVPSAMVVIGSDLYVGGGFTQVLGTGGLTVNRIAKWNGTAWSALGTGTSTGVNALAVIGTDLYAGGSFLTAGGVTVNRIAKWNGSAWSALGAGVNQTVYSLAASGTNLYVGGAFLMASNSALAAVPASKVARWDGTAWSALGSGVDSGLSLPGNVNALAVNADQNLILGGTFFFAGSTPSPYLAQADFDGVNPLITSVTRPADGVYRAGQALNFTVNYSAAVTVTGTPRLPVNIGPFPAKATYVSGSGSKALLFTYTVLAGQTDTDGIAVASWLEPNGGTLQGADGTDAQLTFNPLATGGVLVDTTAPDISLSAPSVSSTVFGPVSYTVTYADVNFSASTLTAADITLNKTGTADGNVAVTGSGLTRTVTISGITGLGTLGISVASGTAADIAGNTAAAAGPSATFAVVLPTPPAITQEPTNVTAVAGANATFTVGATGTAPLRYQWFFNATNVLAGTTNASLTLTNTQPVNGGGYSVVVTNMAGSTTSVVATLTVVVPPSVTSAPANVATNALADVSFTVSAAGTLPLAYQWVKDGVGTISGETNAVLTLNAVTVNTAGGYKVVITNVAGSVTSSVATLTVSRLVPTLTWATPAAITYGTILGAAQLNASAGPPGSFAYSPAAGAVLKAGTRPLNVSFTPSDTSVYAPANSSVTLVVNPAPLTITAQDQTRLYGTANPTLTVSYTGFVNGETAAVLVTAPTASTLANAASLPGTYPVTVSGANGTNYAITHVNGTLTVTADGPTITVPPTDATVIATSNATFSVSATGTGPLRYQWLFNATNVLAGATNAILTVANAQPGNSGGYSVVVTNVVGSVTSLVATLTVLVPPSITAQPESQPVLVGSNVTLTVSAIGTAPLLFQWSKDGVSLLNETNTSLLLPNVVLTNTGFYTVSITNVAGGASSRPASVVVTRAIIQQPAPTQAQVIETGFPLTIAAELGRAFRVQASLDLINWVDVISFTNSGAALEFLDSSATNRTRRFYRVVGD